MNRSNLYPTIVFAKKFKAGNRLASCKHSMPLRDFVKISSGAQDRCLAFLKSPHISVKFAAATCLGDLALFKKPFDAQAVSDALLGACDDPSIADPASVSLSLVNQFATKKH